MYPIIAICGKSASGKDTLARNLEKVFTNKNIDSHLIVSDTTRPMRIREQPGVSYNFVSVKEFQNNIYNDKMLEWTKFRGWYYGTPIHSLKDGIWNIGIFNSTGIKNLIQWEKENSEQFTIIYIYLYANPKIRLRRSKEREGRWRFEYFRRMWTDWRDFRKFKTLTKQQKYGIIIKNESNNYIDNHISLVNKVLLKMTDWRLL